MDGYYLKIKEIQKSIWENRFIYMKKVLNCNKNSVFNEFLIDLNQSFLYLNKNFLRKRFFWMSIEIKTINLWPKFSAEKNSALKGL